LSATHILDAQSFCPGRYWNLRASLIIGETHGWLGLFDNPKQHTRCKLETIASTTRKEHFSENQSQK
jgi:hypothetical protein